MATTEELVDPRLAPVIGDVERPSGHPPLDADLSHIPGSSGLFQGMRAVEGLKRRGVHHQMDALHQHGLVHRSQLGSVSFVAVADPTLVAKIGRNSDKLWSAALGWRVFLEGIGESPTLDSPVAFDFDKHKVVRKLLAPGFSRDALVRYQAMADEHFAGEIALWVEDGKVAFKPHSRGMFAHLANRIFLGLDDPAESGRMDRRMKDFWGSIFAWTHNTWLSPSWRRAVAAYRETHEVLLERVPIHREGGGDDLFSHLCRTPADEEWYSDEVLVKLFFGIMTAAFDTTWMGVSSMVYLLARYPEWQDRLRAEAAEIAPDGVTMDNLKKLVVHDHVWKESLRLYPVTNSLPRRALRDTELAGYHIPAGTLVLAMLGPALHDPVLWRDPEVFDPDRFSKERGEGDRNRSIFMPFGAGAHSCIGTMLSSVEAVTFAHALVTRCRFRLAKDYEGTHGFDPLGSVSGDVDLVLEPL